MARADDLHKRLEALNKKPLQHRPSPGELAEVRRKLQRPKRRAGEEEQRRKDTPPSVQKAILPPPIEHRVLPRTVNKLKQAPARPPVILHEAVTGEEAPSPCGGRAFLVARRAETLVNEAGAIMKRLQKRFAPGTKLQRHLGTLARREDLLPQDLLFFDIETTGLSSAPLFLIGTLEYVPGGMVVRQYFARDYSEESAVTSLFLDHSAHKHLLVSFNGTTFDLRYIRERAVLHGVHCELSHPHLDLLHVSRRAWRWQVPNCRLQTLEQLICKRWRKDDIPGHLIPEAYHAFVRTGDATEMVQVIEHNLLDLVTMVDLLARLPE